jgi:hypothetical protein
MSFMAGKRRYCHCTRPRSGHPATRIRRFAGSRYPEKT